MYRCMFSHTNKYSTSLFFPDYLVRVANSESNWGTGRLTPSLNKFIIASAPRGPPLSQSDS